MKNKPYIQNTGKVIDDKRFEHVMALSLNPKTKYKDGLIRCIISRSGKVHIGGNVDKSKLYKVKSVVKYEKYEITSPLDIKASDELMKKLSFEDLQFLGFEDPDIILDPEMDLIHLYFTIPIVNKPKGKYRVFLGHAQGKDLDSLEMTDPVLPPNIDKKFYAKELSLAPVNSKGKRLNLFESSEYVDETKHTTVRLAAAEDYSKGWRIGKTVLHPLDTGYEWCGGQLSPGPLLPKEFIDPGKNKAVGILNGRQSTRIEKGKIIYGDFSIGITIYDYEKGKVVWVSKEPLIIDSESKTITFASQFIQTKENEGILYAHVDDSFVRAYTLYSGELKKLLP